MKIVLDTNVLISATFWKGNESKIIKKAENGEIQIFTSFGILDEFEDVLLRDKFELKIDEMGKTVEEIIEKLVSIAIVVEPKKVVDVVRHDPDDNKILECAIEAEADYIISGDRHLLDLKEFEHIKIIRAWRLLEILDKKI
ncbi:MAG: putative toxin-antitoxin system toxin component, PIN family [Methanocellales archaeon]|nr:putative toxin-antitoxin system toxin component, PIN family [Methanocellales archaeon]